MLEYQIAIELKKLDGWSRVRNKIRKAWESEDFVRSTRFADSVAVIAEKLKHHTGIDVRGNKVSLKLSTHSAGGFTHLDFTPIGAVEVP